MLLDRPPRMRWPRSQKFMLSPRGDEVELAYRATIVASREQAGRGSFDSARALWAKSNNLQPDDGLYLAEVRSGPVTLQQIIEALETCGKTRRDAIAAMERLVDAGMITPHA